MVVRVITHRGDLVGTTGNDVLTGIASPGTKQIHIYSSSGDDTLHLDFDPGGINVFSHGHHVRGDSDHLSENGRDTFNFKNLGRVNHVVVGRIDDFDPGRDKITIEGQQITLAELTSGSGSTAGFSWRVVEYDSDTRDAATTKQQWLLIDTGQGFVFYGLEGARVTNGDGAATYTMKDPNDPEKTISFAGNQEAHFIGAKNGHIVTAAELQSLPTVGFVNPQNTPQYGYSPDGGIVIKDDDRIFAHSQEIVNGTDRGDLISGGLNDDVINGNGGNDRIWGGTGRDTINGGSGNDIIDGGVTSEFHINTDLSAPAAQIFRVFQSVLGRAPDDAGFNYWVGELSSGRASLIQVISGFTNSQEYLNRFGNVTDAKFLDLLYNFVLDRNPDQAGFNYWHSLLSTGAVTRQDVVRGFSESYEFKNSSDDEFYAYVAKMRPEDDRLTGGPGADTFVFNDRFGRDIITDFSPNTVGEKIDLSGVTSITNYADLVENHLSQDGTNSIISDAVGNSIILLGVSNSSLSADDFVF